jgi:hypothetical protein
VPVIVQGDRIDRDGVRRCGNVIVPVEMRCPAAVTVKVRMPEGHHSAMQRRIPRILRPPVVVMMRTRVPAIMIVGMMVTGMVVMMMRMLAAA